MPKRTFQVFISPLHVVQISCDDLEIVQNVLQFKKDGTLCGQFTQYMGWTELLAEPKDPGSVTRLNLVSTPPSGDAA